MSSKKMYVVEWESVSKFEQRYCGAVVAVAESLEQAKSYATDMNVIFGNLTLKLNSFLQNEYKLWFQNNPMPSKNNDNFLSDLKLWRDNYKQLNENWCTKNLTKEEYKLKDLDSSAYWFVTEVDLLGSDSESFPIAVESEMSPEDAKEKFLRGELGNTEVGSNQI